ncbi:hypothetical protein [Caulobacter mirabilis]|uniref:Uncharacterized protein n=1 Tax=Caulobacter mirabilis TaxID=69666 RepID=A0A2D2B3A5_9CAUL|nr:hypothetical protein [Caulobacter mirabilis]ATQ44723.1 hypothetical protein CSW64_21185 [Caulobacter mirabilis]
MEIRRWHPVTSDMGLIEAPAAAVASEFAAWHGGLGIHYRREEITSSLAASLARLEPLSAVTDRRLFVSTLSGWTAFFQNGVAGSDPFPPMSFLAQHMRVRAMRVCRSPDGARWPAVIWEVYAPPELGGDPVLGIRRSIAAANDGGRWVFEEAGERFDFEEADRYDLPKKRDRFPPELLAQYLAEFRMAPWSDDFYDIRPGSPAIFLDRSNPLSGRSGAVAKSYTLEQVLAGAPWR